AWKEHLVKTNQRDVTRFCVSRQQGPEQYSGSPKVNPFSSSLGPYFGRGLSHMFYNDSSKTRMLVSPNTQEPLVSDRHSYLTARRPLPDLGLEPLPYAIQDWGLSKPMPAQRPQAVGGAWSSRGARTERGGAFDDELLDQRPRMTASAFSAGSASTGKTRSSVISSDYGSNKVLPEMRAPASARGPARGARSRGAKRPPRNLPSGAFRQPSRRCELFSVCPTMNLSAVRKPQEPKKVFISRRLSDTSSTSAETDFREKAGMPSLVPGIVASPRWDRTR
ncbi:unnamed protein product, partial [Polarella glacialis]